MTITTLGRRKPKKKLLRKKERKDVYGCPFTGQRAGSKKPLKQNKRSGMPTFDWLY